MFHMPVEPRVIAKWTAAPPFPVYAFHSQTLLISMARPKAMEAFIIGVALTQ